jgi:hypothetical protein
LVSRRIVVLVELLPLLLLRGGGLLLGRRWRLLPLLHLLLLPRLRLILT